MWPYYLLFLIPATAALVSGNRPANFPAESRGAAPRKHESSGPWFLIAAALVLFVGLRYEVGGDWVNYFVYIDQVQGASFLELLELPDPGYQLLNWVSVQMGWGIYGVNVMGAIAFTTGLVVFCRSLPGSWLAFTVAVPYLVIVVAMGYSRQGVALGFAMLALVDLQRKKAVWFVIWVVVGATFHKTAVLLIPIAALAGSRRRLVTAIWVAVAGIAAYQLFLQDSVDALYENYVEARYASQGALVRLLMNVVPALMLLAKSKKFQFTQAELQLWRWMAFISIGLLALLAVSPSSTAVDRIALYMLPLQMVVFARLPTVLGKPQSANTQWIVAAIFYYLVVLFVWLNFAANASSWIPYQFYPLVGL